MQQYYRCPKCNSPIDFGTKYCIHCGTPIHWPEQQQMQYPPTYESQQYGYQQPSNYQYESPIFQQVNGNIPPKKRGLHAGFKVLLSIVSVIIIIVVLIWLGPVFGYDINPGKVLNQTALQDPLEAEYASLQHWIGTKAPIFSTQSVEGSSFSLNSVQGNIVILVFWKSACEACTNQMPYLQSVYEKWSDDGLIILAINLRDKAPIVQHHIKDMGLTFPILLDLDGEIFEQYEVDTYVPATYFIDDKGNIKHIKLGAFTSSAEIEEITTGINN